MRWIVLPDGSRVDAGQLDREAVEARGVNVVLAKEPTVVADHAMVAGQIPRITGFEQVPRPSRCRWAQAGPTAATSATTCTRPPKPSRGDLVQDVFQGEIATVYNVKDSGLVGIASCGHSGIINTVGYAQQVTGIDATRWSAVGIWPPRPTWSWPGRSTTSNRSTPTTSSRCTARAFYTEALIDHAMPKRLVEPSTGTSVVFGG